MTDNSAAWINRRFDRLTVAQAPFPEPRGNEIIIKTAAVAINPLDRLIQKVGGFLYGWLKYPAILGTDVSGQVVALGPDVKRFRIGDRVLGFAVGVEKSRNRAAEGAFQNYVVVQEHLACPIPPSMSHASAAVLPLGLATAASGMFQKDFLALDYPRLNVEANGKFFLVWGASTSVGSNAVQLAAHAGYTVVATASPRNFDYVKSLGASFVFDYKSRTVKKDIKKTLRKKTFAGAIAVGNGSASACVDLAGACRGKKFVSIATFPVDFDRIPDRTAPFGVALRVVPQMIPASLGLALRSAFSGVKTKFIWGSSMMENEVSRIIFQDFLPSALAEGAYFPAPPAYIVGNGLDAIQTGIDLQSKGVSAQKIVVSLSER